MLIIALVLILVINNKLLNKKVLNLKNKRLKSFSYMSLKNIRYNLSYLKDWLWILTTMTTIDITR